MYNGRFWIGPSFYAFSLRRPLFKQFLPLTPERYFKKKYYRFKEYLKTQT